MNFAKLKFPDDIAEVFNSNNVENVPLIEFKNYIPMDKSMQELINDVDHFKSVDGVEKHYVKKIAKTIMRADRDDIVNKTK